MNDHAAFERAIRKSPHDQAPRLVYADWLEEQDYDEWARLMRQTTQGTLECTWDEWNTYCTRLVPQTMNAIVKTIGTNPISYAYPPYGNPAKYFYGIDLRQVRDRPIQFQYILSKCCGVGCHHRSGFEYYLDSEYSLVARYEASTYSPEEHVHSAHIRYANFKMNMMIDEFKPKDKSLLVPGSSPMTLFAYPDVKDYEYLYNFYATYDTAKPSPRS